MEPLHVPGASDRPARRVVVAAGLILVAVYAVEARGSFEWLANPRPVTPADDLGPFTKGSDSMGYYAWLRSPLIDGDFRFDNEFAPTFARVPGSEAAFPLTATGHRHNPWPVGPAIAWAPAVAKVHVVLRALGDRSPWPADGFSPPYQLAVGLTTLALCLVALGLSYRIARRFAGPTPAAVAAALAILATPVVCYGAVEVSLSHGPASAALALYVFVWLKTFGSTRPGRWAAVGGLLGLAALMRWQLSTFALLPAFEAAWLASRTTDWRQRVGLAARLALAAAASVVVFTPHFAARQVVFGHPLGGMHKTAQNWFDPSLWAVLGSTEKSLCYWTPVALPALVGLAYLAVRSGRAAGAMLAAAVAVQVYAVAAILGGEAYLGWAFGFRFLTETCVLLAPGLAVLFARVGPCGGRRLAVVAGLLVWWNLMLLGGFRHHTGCPSGGTPVEMLEMVYRYVLARPFEAVMVLVAVGWLTRVLVVAFREEPTAAAAVPREEPLRRAA